MNKSIDKGFFIWYNLGVKLKKEMKNMKKIISYKVLENGLIDVYVEGEGNFIYSSLNWLKENYSEENYQYIER